MELNINRDVFFEALGHVQGITEKKSTLPILSNVLLEVKSSKLTLTSTDLDIIFVEEISNLEVIQEGVTTTSANILFDIIRKFPSNSKISIKLKNGSKLEIKSGHSCFNLLCLSHVDFPLSQQEFEKISLKIDSRKLLKLINKTKFSVSNDETRHYLSGILLHKKKINDSFFLTAAATDSHRMSISSLSLENDISFEPVILPKKTIFLLSTLLENVNDSLSISNDKSKIQFQFKNSVLISKVIDGKFPKYDQVVPKNNEKILKINLKSFINSVDRVIAVSSDRKEGVKMNISKENVKFSVNNPNSGDGTEIVKSEFNSEDMNVSFNSKYLMDISSQIEGDSIVFNLNDAGSPAIIKDLADKDSIYVVMPMKI